LVFGALAGRKFLRLDVLYKFAKKIKTRYPTIQIKIFYITWF